MPQSQTKYKSKKQISQEADAWAKKLFQTIGSDFKPGMKESAKRNKDLISARTKQNKAMVTSFNKGQKADAARTKKLNIAEAKLDYKQVPHTEVDQNVSFTSSPIPGMPMQASGTETRTAIGARTAEQDQFRLAALDKEISRLAGLKEVGEDVYSPEDAKYYKDINAAKRAHIARLVSERNSLVSTAAPDDTSKVDPAANIANMTKANPDSVAAVLAKLSMEPATIDSTKKAEAEKKKNDPNNFSTNQKTNFRKAWRKKNAKALNSKDPKVSTPAKLKYQQLKDWRDGKIPFPDTLKNEL